MTRVVVIGQGYVGLPLAMRAVEAGYEVVGYDTDAARVKRLIAGESYVEDVPEPVLAAALESGRYLPTIEEDDCAGYGVAVITVPTPLRDGVPDLSFVEAAGRTLGRHLTEGACVVLESTTYPGTTEELLAPILDEASGLVAGEGYHLGYSPERIDPGNPVWGLANTPKIVSGVNGASLVAVRSFYDSLVAETVPVSGTREAEMTKLIENTFRHVNIALVNELAMFAGDLGVDIWEALDAAQTKPFGFMRFDPGPGVGGHCLPVDPSYLAWRVRRRVGAAFRFVELANEVNDHMPEYVVRRLARSLNRQGKCVSGSRILLLGLSYKPNTSDLRESPALVVAGLLRELGANVRAADPHVEPEWVGDAATLTELTLEEVDAADAVIVLTNHSRFDLEMVADRARLVLDTRRSMPAGTGERL